MSTTMELIGTRLGRYDIVEHLATGGMAEIYLASQDSLGKFKKDLVLKVLQTRWEEYPEVVEMFLEEARISALMKHPNIVDVFDVAVERDRHYIAMEHIAGRTLAELAQRAIQVTKSISIEVGAYIAAEMASALAYMYDGEGMSEPLRVIHRDISPTNILISTTGQVKLIDFGIARQGTITPDSRARPGKFTYMSPEQVKSEPMDGRSDIFCLGTILYEITLGRRLWRGTREAATKRIVEERPKPPTFVRRDYPAELELIVLRALEKKPEDRYQSAVELHNDLQGFMSRSNAHLRSHSHMADYVAKIFSEEAEALISDAGRRRAQDFVDNSEGSEGSQGDLDFDAELAAGPGAALARALRASALGVWAELPPPAGQASADGEAALGGPGGDATARSSVLRDKSESNLDAKLAAERVGQPVAEKPAAEKAPVEKPPDGQGAADNLAQEKSAVARKTESGASTPASPAAKPVSPQRKSAAALKAQPERSTDTVPRRWGPILIATIVLAAALGAVWFLRGQ